MIGNAAAYRDGSRHPVAARQDDPEGTATWSDPHGSTQVQEIRLAVRARRR